MPGTFDLPLMKALDWAETSGKTVTIDICPLTSLASEVLNHNHNVCMYKRLSLETMNAVRTLIPCTPIPMPQVFRE